MLKAEQLERLKADMRAIEGRTASQSPSTSPSQFPSPGSVESNEPARSRKANATAFDKIVNLLNVSDRSERALRDRLARDGYAMDEIEEAIGRAKSYGFVDDVRYAEVLVRSRISQGKGSAGIERELREQGIDVTVVPGWPHEFAVGYEDELDRALDLLRRKPPRSKNLREGAFRKLVGKGYSPSVASSAARQWAEDALCP